ncbi:hypothetical protein Godav_013977 [Gossypium davidsonii]|uniref:Uncharacterized protein n=1 Tax=Gossypium davidsonii TaxID=34287 RepID=A0A7J8RIN3_GOSDV|nr:hypothetical protein [Gossypium davidsonii]
MVPDWFEWLTWAFDKCSNSQKWMICESLWVLWTERNKLRSGIVSRKKEEE